MGFQSRFDLDGSATALPWQPTGRSGSRVPGRRDQGTLSYYRGLSAEDQVISAYAARGARLRARRWRSAAGEIDLIFAGDRGLIFVEVKAADSHAQALSRIGQAQLRRIERAAQIYLAAAPEGPLGDWQFEVALVDRQGCVQIRDDAVWIEERAA